MCCVQTALSKMVISNSKGKSLCGHCTAGNGKTAVSVTYGQHTLKQTMHGGCMLSTEQMQSKTPAAWNHSCVPVLLLPAIQNSSDMHEDARVPHYQAHLSCMQQRAETDLWCNSEARGRGLLVVMVVIINIVSHLDRLGHGAQHVPVPNGLCRPAIRSQQLHHELVRGPVQLVSPRNRRSLTPPLGHGLAHSPVCLCVKGCLPGCGWVWGDAWGMGRGGGVHVTSGVPSVIALAGGPGRGGGSGVAAGVAVWGPTAGSRIRFCAI